MQAAGRTSPWAGMGHAGPLEWRTWQLQPGAAVLEVTMDPAAHGPDAVGPWTRGITLRTSSGQELQFTLKATIVR